VDSRHDRPSQVQAHCEPRAPSRPSLNAHTVPQCICTSVRTSERPIPSLPHRHTSPERILKSSNTRVRALVHVAKKCLSPRGRVVMSAGASGIRRHSTGRFDIKLTFSRIGSHRPRRFSARI